MEQEKQLHLVAHSCGVGGGGEQHDTTSDAGHAVCHHACPVECKAASFLTRWRARVLAQWKTLLTWHTGWLRVAPLRIPKQASGIKRRYKRARPRIEQRAPLPATIVQRLRLPRPI